MIERTAGIAWKRVIDRRNLYKAREMLLTSFNNVSPSARLPLLTARLARSQHIYSVNSLGSRGGALRPY